MSTLTTTSGASVTKETGKPGTPVLTLIFASASLTFSLLLVFLRTPFPAYSLISWQDVFDMLTPLVLIPLYWLLFKAAASEAPSGRQEILFMVLAAIWVLGQGMHLAANSINNLAEALARQGELDITRSSIYQLTYFYDEHLSHITWHIGIIGLAGILLYRAWQHPEAPGSAGWQPSAAGILYGITLFCIFLEGQTVFLGLPFVALVTLLCALRGRAKLSREPLITFFFISCALALVLFAAWGAYWRGFPQFSDVGLL